MRTMLMSVFSLGVSCSPLLHAQPEAATTVANQDSPQQLDEGYIRKNGQNYVVVNNVAYPIMGDITQRITPESAAKLRDGYMLNTSNELVILPPNLKYADSAFAPGANGGENVSGLAPSASMPAQPEGTSGSATAGTPQRFSGNTNGGARTNANRNATPNAGDGNGTVSPSQNGTQPNGTIAPQQPQKNIPQHGSQLRAAQGTQGNGTQPQMGNGTQPQMGNGTQPQMGNGTQPQVGNGTQPQVGNGTQPQVGNGTQPQMGNGTQPQMGDGTQPQMGDGTQPQVGNGTQPQVGNGTQPNGTIAPPAQPQARVPNGAQPNGTIAPQPRQSGAGNTRNGTPVPKAGAGSGQ